MGRIHVLVLAMLALAGPAAADEITGAVVGDDGAGIPRAVVRIVAEKVVVVARTDHRGLFRVNGLPAGTYRVEVDHGFVQPALAAPTPSIRIDRDYIRCCACAMARSRSFANVLALGSTSAPGHVVGSTRARGHVDTRSTAQGVVIRAPGR